MNKKPIEKEEDVAHKFKEIIVTEDVLIEYKKQYRNLGRIRVGSTYSGILLIDKNDVFVAVLNINKTNSDIQALDIHPDYRRKGIAKYLLDLANNRYHAHKLTVRETNAPAIKLYLKYGYEVYKKEGIMLYMKLSNKPALKTPPVYSKWTKK